jgi:hypothetical protein
MTTDMAEAQGPTSMKEIKEQIKEGVNTAVYK